MNHSNNVLKYKLEFSKKVLLCKKYNHIKRQERLTKNA